MELFLNIIQFLTSIAVAITTIRMYFTVNKIWKRKSDNEVCASISIFAYSLAIMVHLPMMIRFLFIDTKFDVAANELISILAYLMIILIGSGFWVRENKKEGLFKLILKALKLEHKEKGELVKSITRPSGASKIIKILQKVASLDNDFSDAEVKIISDFANGWNIELPDWNMWRQKGQSSLLDVRNSLEEYLNTTPPNDQAAELIDLLEIVIKADNVVSKEEELFLREATAIIRNYVSQDETQKSYYVLLVPQNEQQKNAIHDLFPEAKFVERRGGNVFVRGQYYSRRFAEAICTKYIELGLFTITERV
ncbi:MAG: hypothetical protein NT007_08350 [Candidatus Kapabacteria bacterium]|nr:hypothetical protein [Candidatus Kapabacteria bacterium]